MFSIIQILTLTLENFVPLIEPSFSMNLNRVYYLSIFLQNSVELKIGQYNTQLVDAIRNYSNLIDQELDKIRSSLETGNDVKSAYMLCSTSCSYYQDKLFTDNFINWSVKLCSTQAGKMFLRFIQHSNVFIRARSSFFISFTLGTQLTNQMPEFIFYLIKDFFLKRPDNLSQISSKQILDLLHCACESSNLGHLVAPLVKAAYSPQLIIDFEDKDNQVALEETVNDVCKAKCHIYFKIQSLRFYKTASSLQLVFTNSQFLKSLIDKTSGVDSSIYWQFLNYLANFKELQSQILNNPILCSIFGDTDGCPSAVLQNLKFTLRFVSKGKLSTTLAAILLRKVSKIFYSYNNRYTLFTDYREILHYLKKLFKLCKKVTPEVNQKFYTSFHNLLDSGESEK